MTQTTSTSAAPIPQYTGIAQRARAGRYAQPARLSEPTEFKDALVAFARHLRARGRSPDTCAAYIADLRKFREALMSDLGREPVLAEVSRQWIEIYLDYLHDRRLAPKTRHRAACAIKAMFRFCADSDLVPHDPAEKVPGVAVPSTLPSYLDPHEVKRFLDGCIGPLVKVIVAVIYCTGLRIGELCALMLDDVDLERGTLRVAMGKGGKERILPLNDKAKEWLHWYLTDLRPDVQSNQFFVSPRRRNLNRHWAETIVRQEAQRQGWTRRITPHTFRHAHATALYRAGVGIVTIAAILGHADISTTQVYTHVSGQDLMQAMEKLPAI